MAFYVQFNKADGSIIGTNLTDLPAPIITDDAVGQLTFDEWQQTMNKLVNTATLALEDSPQ